MNSIITRNDLFCNEKLDFSVDTPRSIQKRLPLVSSTESTVDLVQSSHIPESLFFRWLDEVKKEKNPYLALSNRCRSIRYIQFESGACVTCTFYEKAWNSTAFGKTERGKFQYIDLFEYTEKKLHPRKEPLLRMRMNSIFSKGEWLSVNRGKQISGKQVVTVAEKISRAMRIKKCFLADTAQIQAQNGRKMHLRFPLQVMRGYGYYGPLFTLAYAKEIPSRISIPGKKKLIQFNQEPKLHKEKVAWMQALTVEDLKDKILAGVADCQEKLALIIQEAKLEASTTFQLLLQTLYKSKDSSPKALDDYEWTVFCLLDSKSIPADSKIQEKYLNILGMLNINVLMTASFA